jgi:hypothetical protein
MSLETTVAHHVCPCRGTSLGHVVAFDDVRIENMGNLQAVPPLAISSADILLERTRFLLILRPSAPRYRYYLGTLRLRPIRQSKDAYRRQRGG